jgi:hypothetical protein
MCLDVCELRFEPFVLLQELLYGRVIGVTLTIAL